MPLIVEDGTMPIGANSYASLESANAYLLARKAGEWPAPTVDNEGNFFETDTPGKESALIKATDYLNGLSWYGRKKPLTNGTGGRVMAWPRIEVVDADNYTVADDIVPAAVVDACCYLAGFIYGGGDPQPTLERGGRVAAERVGSLSTSYFDDAANRDVYSALADLLKGLAKGFDNYAGLGNGANARTTIHRLVLG